MIGVVSAGEARDLLHPRVWGGLVLYGATGGALARTASALGGGAHWGRGVAILAFILIALFVGGFTIWGVWISHEEKGVDGAAYLFLGGLSILGVSIAGVVSAIRRTH